MQEARIWKGGQRIIGLFYPLGIQSQAGEGKDQEVDDITGHVLSILVSPISNISSGKSKHKQLLTTEHYKVHKHLKCKAEKE